MAATATIRKKITRKAKPTNGEYAIEKNVPVPTARRGQYPFKDMDVGDSFTAPAGTSKLLRVSVFAWARRNDRKFATRTEGNRVRVWRIA